MKGSRITSHPFRSELRFERRQVYAAGSSGCYCHFGCCYLWVDGCAFGFFAGGWPADRL